jgi:hypothetical protein
LHKFVANVATKLVCFENEQQKESRFSQSLHSKIQLFADSIVKSQGNAWYWISASCQSKLQSSTKISLLFVRNLRRRKRDTPFCFKCVRKWMEGFFD